jgi:hypothetical protein
MLSRKALPHGSVLSLLFILGFLMAVFFNVLVNGCYLVLLLLRKPFRQQVPGQIVRLQNVLGKQISVDQAGWPHHPSRAWKPNSINPT